MLQLTTDQFFIEPYLTELYSSTRLHDLPFEMSRSIIHECVYRFDIRFLHKHIYADIAHLLVVTTIAASPKKEMYIIMHVFIIYRRAFTHYLGYSRVMGKKLSILCDSILHYSLMHSCFMINA